MNTTQKQFATSDDFFDILVVLGAIQEPTLECFCLAVAGGLRHSGALKKQLTEHSQCFQLKKAHVQVSYDLGGAVYATTVLEKSLQLNWFPVVGAKSQEERDTKIDVCVESFCKQYQVYSGKCSSINLDFELGCITKATVSHDLEERAESPAEERTAEDAAAALTPLESLTSLGLRLQAQGDRGESGYPELLGGPTPIQIGVGDRRVLINGHPTKVPLRLVSEETYSMMEQLTLRALGFPGSSRADTLTTMASPLMKYMASKHPHMKAIVTSTSAEVLEGVESHNDESFIKD